MLETTFKRKYKFLADCCNSLAYALGCVSVCDALVYCGVRVTTEDVYTVLVGRFRSSYRKEVKCWTYSIFRFCYAEVGHPSTC